MILRSQVMNIFSGHFKKLNSILRGGEACGKQLTHFKRTDSVDDVKDLTGRKKVPQFVCCGGLLFCSLLVSLHAGLRLDGKGVKSEL